jgi:AcrR family transcriptional regulator
MARPSKKEHLVETAVKLFGRDGFHATGIDKILQEAGVARMTLYKHFRSKDELILAALRRRDEQFRIWFKSAIEKTGGTPAERLLASFDALEEWFAGKAFAGVPFTGCSFINATAEFSEKNHPVHQLAAEHKRLILEYLRLLASSAGAREPDSLAWAISLLHEGAIVTAQVSSDIHAASGAKKIARTVMAQHGVDVSSKSHVKEGAH